MGFTFGVRPVILAPLRWKVPAPPLQARERFMYKFLIRRLIFSIFTLIGATIIVFTLSRVVGDPRLLYAQEGGYGLSDQAWDDLGVMLGLDKPLIVQYFLWVGDVVSGDLGESLLGRVEVSKLIRQKAPNTLQLGLVSWAIATFIGIPLGVLSAVKRGSFWDYLGRAFALLGQAAPPFWIGIMAILLFAVRLDWLPAGGREEGIGGLKFHTARRNPGTCSVRKLSEADPFSHAGNP